MARTFAPRAHKKYLIQHKGKNGKWGTLNLDFHGPYVQDFSEQIGSNKKPDAYWMERAMKFANDFSKENFRVIERTVIWYDEVRK